MDVQKEINELRRKLNYYGKLYYVDDAPAISDYEYDMLMQQLKALEKEHPELITPDSPTQRIGGPALSKFEPVHHQVPLESLTDVFSVDELFAFGERMDSMLPGHHSYTVEPKIDGLSMSLEYENGVFVRDARRRRYRRGRHRKSPYRPLAPAQDRKRPRAPDRPRRGIYVPRCI